jgi:dGTPase
MLALRAFMFDTVYDNPVKRNEERKATYIIEEMFDHFIKNPDALPDEYRRFIGAHATDRVVCDYIAGMSDDYAVHTFNNIFVPKSWTVF